MSKIELGKDIKDQEISNIPNVLFFHGNHPAHLEYLLSPPEGIKLISSSRFNKESHITNSRLNDFFRNAADECYHICGLPRFVFLNSCGIDLIHSTRGFLIANRKPWLVDFEHVKSFQGMRNQKKASRRTHKILLRWLGSPYCKKIIAWSLAAKKSIENTLDTLNIKEKIEVVYPAIRKLPVERQNNPTKLKILFIGQIDQTDIYGRRPLETIDVYNRLKQKYDLELIMVTNRIKWIKQKAIELKGITFVQTPLSREKLLANYFLKCHIFLYPTTGDSFGMVLLEAMSAEMAIVTTDVFAVPEIIENEKTGLIVISPVSWVGPDYLSTEWNHKKWLRNKEEFVCKLAWAVERLINDDNLRQTLGRNAGEVVKSGKFSIRRRNEKMRQIYFEALGIKP